MCLIELRLGWERMEEEEKEEEEEEKRGDGSGFRVRDY